VCKIQTDLFNTLKLQNATTQITIRRTFLRRYDQLSLFENLISNKRKSDPNLFFAHVYSFQFRFH